MTIYLSIPITGHALVTQKAKAAEIAEQIRALGHEPVNPFDTPEPPAELSERERYAYYMGEDIKRLLMCDAILLCEGWRKSKGCNLEHETANAYGLLVFHNISAIPPCNSVAPEFEEKLRALASEYGLDSYFMQYSVNNQFHNVMRGSV